MLDNLYAWHQRFIVERQRHVMLKSFECESFEWEDVAAYRVWFSAYCCDIPNHSDAGTWGVRSTYLPNVLTCFVEIEDTVGVSVYWRVTLHDGSHFGYVCVLQGLVQHDRWQDAAGAVVQVIDYIVTELRHPGKVNVRWTRRLPAVIESTSQAFHNFQYTESGQA
jgi:hypothetical protein